MPLFERPSAIRAGTSRSRPVSWPTGLAGRARRSSRETIVGSITHSPSCTRVKRVGEHAHPGHAFLEQVTGTARVLLDQPHRVARLEVVGQDQHPHVRMRRADFPGGDRALIGIGGDRGVGPRQLDLAARLPAVPALPMCSAGSRTWPPRGAGS
jgi:hypothetical protein